MARNGVARMAENQRWTSKRKADVVLEIIKGKVTIMDFCRANDLKQTDVEKWMEEFVSGGTQALKANPKDIRAEHHRRKAAMEVLGRGASP